MGVIFFITTVVFFALFLGARSDISMLRRENEQLKNKLNEKQYIQPQETKLKDDNEAVKPEPFTDDNKQIKNANSPYNTSYMHQKQPVMSASFTDDNVESPQNTPPKPQTSETNNAVGTPKSENNAPTVAVQQEKHRVSSINVLLIIGSLLIILAGVIFATTTWATLGNIVKAVIILSFSAVLFAASSIAERKFDLPKTGKVFYTLGCAFLPITVFAIAYFKIFGDWFSISGNGFGTVWAVAAALTAAVCFKGSYDYKSKFFACVSLGSISVMVAGLASQIFDSPDFIELIYAVYSLVVIFVSRLIQKKAVKLNAFAYIIDVLPSFELGNTALLSIVSLVVPAAWLDHSVIVTISCGLFAAAYLFSGFSKKNGFAGAIPFLIFVSIASFYGFSPESFSEGTYVVAAIATVTTVLSLLKVLPEKLAFALKILSNICIAVSAFALSVAAISSEITLASVIIMTILTAEILVLGLFRRNESAGKIMIVLFAFALSSTILSALKLITSSDSVFAIASSGVLLAVSIGYVITDFIFAKKGKNFIIRSVFTDVMFAAFIAGVLLSQFSDRKLPVVVILFTAAAQFVYAVFPKKDWEKLVFSLTAMLSLGKFAADGTLAERFSETVIFTVVSAALAVISITWILVKKDKLIEKGTFIGFTVVTSILILVSSVKIFSTPDLVWQFWLILAIVCTVKGCISKHKVPLSAAIILFCLAFGGFAYEVLDFGTEAELIAAGGFASVLFASLLFAPHSELVNYCRKFTFLCLDFISFALLCTIASASEVSASVIAGAVIVFAMTVTSSIMTFGSVFLIPPLAAAYFTVAGQMQNVFAGNSNVAVGASIAAMIALSVGASFLFYRKSVFEKSRKDCDGFAFSRLIGLAAYFSYADGEISEWLGLLLTSVVIVSFLRKENKPLSNRIITSVAMFVPVIAWWTQPFWKLPEGYALEINIVPILLYLAALRLLKWDKKHIDILTFVTYIIVYAILFFHALSGTIVNALIVMISAFVILAVSFFVKMKRWFVLSAAVIVTSAIFMSIKLWGSPAWWVYLLAAGIILIAVGAVNEQKKKSADGGVAGKITRFMSEWTW